MFKHKVYISKVWQKRKKVIDTFVFSVGMLVFLYCLYQIPLVKNKIPYFSNQVQAYKYERMAKKLPSGDMEAQRLRAMAEAIKKNSSDYHFETGPLPPMK